MRKLWRRLLVLLGIFVLAAAAFAFYLHSQSNEEPTGPSLSYQNLEASSLPIISSTACGYRVNPLHGFASERDLDATETPVMIAANNEVNMEIALYGSKVESVDWQIRERGSEENWDQGSISSLSDSGESAFFTIKPQEDLGKGVEYFLDMTLHMDGDRSVYYYARVRSDLELHDTELFSLAMNIHNAGYNMTEAEKLKDYLENDGSQSNKTLATVNIHSTLGQLTWGSLGVSEVPGSLSVQILEIDGNFASILMQYYVTGGTDEEEMFFAEEYYSTHWTKDGIYLMDFERNTTELFSEHSSRLADGNLNFGVVNPEDVNLIQSENQSYTVFSVGNELWCYNSEDAMLSKVYSQLDTGDLLRSGFRQSEIKVLKADDSGNIVFMQYGYMNRGKHEGTIGVSCMQYSQKEHELAEIFFLPYSGSFDYLRAGIEKLVCLGADGQVYLMVGDSVYTVNTESQEVIMLANQAQKRSLVVNDSHTAIAWQLDSKQEMSNRVQILYLDTGEKQVVEVDEGDWIAPQGFIDDDCVLGEGHIGDEAEANMELVNPFYAVVIRNRKGKEEVRYQFDNIYISYVKVNKGQVVLDRLQKDETGFHVVNGDTLIQNEVSEEEEILLTAKSDDVRRTVYVLEHVADGVKVEDIQFLSMSKITYGLSDSFVLASVEDEYAAVNYYAYQRGHLAAVTSEAGPAIAAAFDGMGTVIDSRGRVVWYRTGREIYFSLKAEEYLTGTVAESCDLCLTMIGRISGQPVSKIDLMEAESVRDAMETIAPGKTLNLSGAPVKALLYYVYRGNPILVLQDDGHAFILIGYDQYNVALYDPVEGKNIYMGMDDAGAYFDADCSLLGFMS